MKVKDLLKKLEGCNEDDDVIILIGKNCMHQIKKVKVGNLMIKDKKLGNYYNKCITLIINNNEITRIDFL